MSCADCQKYIYDKNWERETYAAGSPDNLLPMLRHGPPPCQLGAKCPKVSPEHEHEYVLSWRNTWMYQAYREHRAAGINPDDPPDAVRRECFAIIDALVRRWESKDSAERLAYAIIGSL